MNKQLKHYCAEHKTKNLALADIQIRHAFVAGNLEVLFVGQVKQAHKHDGYRQVLGHGLRNLARHLSHNVGEMMHARHWSLSLQRHIHTLGG